VEDILHERGVDICHETVRFWVERFGSKFAGEICKNRAGHHSNWQWHLDEGQCQIKLLEIGRANLQRLALSDKTT
jgi:transposase-like protein